MDYDLLLRPEARTDLLDAFYWYQEKQAGLGHDFKLCVDVALSKIVKNPSSYKNIYNDIRRVVIRKFPFAIFYMVEENSVVVLAVLHARRNPVKWKSRKY